MVEENVNPVHRQYMDLSGRYKAAWTFHRFIQGLRKFFGSQDLEDHTADFQELYAGLKEVSKRLNDPDIQSVIDRLEGLRQRLDELMETLDREDRRVAPSLVRLFFQRVKTYDDRILLDLIRFYLEVQRDRSWESDRVDKADFLLTRLAEAVGGKEKVSESSRLNRVLDGVATHQRWSPDVDPKKVANRQKMIQAVRAEILQLERFEDLTERDLVGHYRHLKHGLGRMLFEKSILPAIVDTNLVLASRIRELSRDEEKRILEDYEKVSRLAREGEVDRELADNVNRLHRQVSHFRKQIGSGSLRLQDVTQIRRLVIDILDQVEESALSSITTGDEAPADPVAERLSVNEAIGSREERRLIGYTLEDLVSVLRKSSDLQDGERRLEAQALAFRLEDRELAAFDRLSSDEECDETLERFILSGAALRRRINDEVNEIHSHRSRTGNDAEPLESTAALLELGDWYLRRYSHFLERASLGGQESEARLLQVLRMRLMRDYSGLWLVEND